MMTLTTFQNGLDQWGSRLEDWPPREQRAARQMLLANPAAGDLLLVAEQLTAGLQKSSAGMAGEALRLRLKTIPAHYPQPSRLPAKPVIPSWAPGWLWGGGVALASTGMMALGFMAGFGGVITLDANLVDWAALAYGSL